MLFFGIISTSFSQVTTASLRGVVATSNGETLPGASVLAIHVPSGTQYGTETQSNGAFNIPNMRVGGPYKIVASYIGYKEKTFENVFLKIGEKLKLNFKLSEEASQLDEIVIKCFFFITNITGYNFIRPANTHVWDVKCPV